MIGAATARADGAETGSLVGAGGSGGDKSQPDLGKEQMLQTVGSHGIGAGDDIIAALYRSGQQFHQQFVAQRAAVLQYIQPGTKGLGGIKEGHVPLVGDGGEKTAGDLPLFAVLFWLELSAQDTTCPSGKPLAQLWGEKGGPDVLRQFKCGIQTAISPTVTGGVTRHTGHDLFSHRLQSLAVVAGTKIYVLFHCPGELGLQRVGGGGIGEGDIQFGQEQSVQRVGIPGTQDALGGQSGLQGMLLHLPHEGGLAAARAALDEIDTSSLGWWNEFRVERIKTCRGVCPQKKGRYSGHI